MTREEAKRILYVYRAVNLVDASHREAFDMAIKALEQQPILDKIRAEIESVIQEETVIVHPEARNGYESVVLKLDPDDVFQIIDKYKAESEAQDDGE